MREKNFLPLPLLKLGKIKQLIHSTVCLHHYMQLESALTHSFFLPKQNLRVQQNRTQTREAHICMRCLNLGVTRQEVQFLRIILQMHAQGLHARANTRAYILFLSLYYHATAATTALSSSEQERRAGTFEQMFFMKRFLLLWVKQIRILIAQQQFEKQHIQISCLMFI